MNRAVTLTALRLLFEEQVLPAMTANRAIPSMLPHAAPRPMNRAPAAFRLPTRRAPHPSAPERPLGTSSAAPIWAWGGRNIPCAPTAAPRTPAREVAALAGEHANAACALSSARPLPCMAAPEPPPTSSMEPTMTDAAREVRMPTEILRAMAAAAAATGRPESALWAEAARLWLALHAQDDHPQPPAPAAALVPVPAVRAARDRCWGAIDILLSDLRPSTRVPAAAPAVTQGWSDPAA